MRFHRIAAGAGLLLSCVAFHASGTVSVCDEPSLDAALAGGGAVDFACDGTIVLTATKVIAQDTVLSGAGYSVTLSGNDAVRLFSVDTGVRFTVDSLVLEHGLAVPTVAAPYGGGAILSRGILTVINSALTANQALGAQGADGFGPCQAGAPGNAGLGGAIHVAGGSLTVSYTNFENNLARGGTGGTGGPNIFCGGAGNGGAGGAGRGGAIAFTNNIVRVLDSTFTANTAQAGQPGAQGPGGGGASGGAGLATGGAVYSVGVLDATRASFTGNATAAGVMLGGALYGGTICTNCTFDLNTAGAGAAIAAAHLVQLKNSTVNGGGLFIHVSIAPFELYNSALKAGGSANCQSTIADMGGNLSSDNSCAFTQPNSLNNSDPLFGPPEWTFGTVPTLPLLAGSPAIDAADPANCPLTDARSASRVGACDSGAYEYGAVQPAPPTVTGFTPGAGVTGTWVTITGSGFDSTRRVRFGAFDAGFSILDDATLQAAVPAGFSTAKIEVTNAAGSKLSKNLFTNCDAQTGPGNSFTLVRGAAPGALDYAWGAGTLAGTYDIYQCPGGDPAACEWLFSDTAGASLAYSESATLGDAQSYAYRILQNTVCGLRD